MLWKLPKNSNALILAEKNCAFLVFFPSGACKALHPCLVDHRVQSQAPADKPYSVQLVPFYGLAV